MIANGSYALFCDVLFWNAARNGSVLFVLDEVDESPSGSAAG